MLSDLQAFLQSPARAVDLQDHQVGALLLGGVQLAVEIRLQPGTDLALKANDDSMVVLCRLLGEPSEAANRNTLIATEERSRRLCKDLPFKYQTNHGRITAFGESKYSRRAQLYGS